MYRLGAGAGAGAGAPGFTRLRGVSMTTADCTAFAAAPTTLRRLFGAGVLSTANEVAPSGAGAGALTSSLLSQACVPFGEAFAAAAPIRILVRLPAAGAWQVSLAAGKVAPSAAGAGVLAPSSHCCGSMPFGEPFAAAAPIFTLDRLPAAGNWQVLSAAGAGAASSVGDARGLSTGGGGSPGDSPFVSGSPPMAGVCRAGSASRSKAQLVLSRGFAFCCVGRL